MFKTLKRWWKYLGPKLGMTFKEQADPKVQLEQAIAEAQEQHRRLKEQAANVIANQKTTEMQLDQKMGELEKLNANARQAVLMADEAAKTGDAAKTTEYTQAAEAFANRLIALESEIEGLKTMALQAAQASDQAKAAVSQNSAVLQKKLVREAEAALPARPGEDAGAAQRHHGVAVGDGRPGRARRSTRCARRSSSATPRPARRPSSRAPRSSRRCSRSSTRR